MMLTVMAIMALGAASPAPKDNAVVVAKAGSQATTAGAAAKFTGKVSVDSRFQRSPPARVGGGIVTFEAGARTAWHSRPLGQTLIVSAGQGLVQHWNGPIQQIGVGDVVWIPPEVKHWHGATPTKGMTHVAIAEALDGRSTTWMEKVSDAQYGQEIQQWQMRMASNSGVVRSWSRQAPWRRSH